MARSCERIIHRGDELYIYYCGVHGAHTGPNVTEVVRKHRTAVGLLIQRRDGFVSLDAGDEPGYVLTKAFPWPGGTLHLNADAADGAVRVALCADFGTAIPGLESSLTVHGNQLDAVIGWPDGSHLPKAGAPVKLKLSAQRARLYSYWFE